MSGSVCKNIISNALNLQTKCALGSPAGYIKPVGQSWKLDEFGNKVDKDAPVFKDHFGLKDELTTMSPVIIKSGFTKRFLDGEVDMQDERARMQACYEQLCSRYDQVVVEGTGHTGVGTIIGLNNAQDHGIGILWVKIVVS